MRTVEDVRRLLNAGADKTSFNSAAIANPDVISQASAKYGAQFLLKPPRPPHWGGFRLRPDQWEFWQGRKSRLHDRLRYRLEDGAWERERLAP